VIILDYYARDDQSHWLEEIKKSDWSAGQYLYERLRDHRLKELCGQSTKVLLQAEGEHLISFCTYAEQDDVREPALTPWIGFVYTFPTFRGKRYMGNLLEYAESIARKEDRGYIYISTGETGLYEKYGYSFWKMMKDVNGEDSRVYRKEIRDISCCRVMTTDDYDKVYNFWMSCKNMGFNNLDDSREGIARFLRRNPATSFVAVEDGRLAGIVLSGHDGRRGYVYHMSVAEDFRRRGVGTALLNRCLEALKAEGINKAALLVFRYNAAGNAFWEKQGFSAREDVAYRNRELAEMVRIDT
jgi:ribosomal protein S18 acetylase RimI-like enzyme